MAALTNVQEPFVVWIVTPPFRRVKCEPVSSPVTPLVGIAEKWVA